MTRLNEDEARALDAADPLAAYRTVFRHPVDERGREKVYFCGNSLGLQPNNVAETIDEELDSWGRRAVDGHFEGPRPWFDYHERFAAPLARLVGAHPDEVVAMNSLTVNLHLLMVSFYRPEGARRGIAVEPFAFPSDNFAVRSQIAFHGGDPDRDLVAPEPEGSTVPFAAWEALFEERGDRIALVLLGGVNYFTGQAYDLGRIATLARRHGAVVGVDLAHAVGNLPLTLHDDGVDFAVWCSYKYLNAGPGAIAGAFVHRRHVAGERLPRFEGWWGHDASRRFRMHLEPRFVPMTSAEAWQLSNPPILAMAPLLASLHWFERAGMDALRAKSVQLTGALERSLDALGIPGLEILTPRDPDARGCQLSLRFRDGVEASFEALRDAGIVVDVRRPDVLRVAPVPLYNRFDDVRRLSDALAAAAGRR